MCVCQFVCVCVCVCACVRCSLAADILTARLLPQNRSHALACLRLKKKGAGRFCALLRYVLHVIGDQQNGWLSFWFVFPLNKPREDLNQNHSQMSELDRIH